ncbi:hypothetical protein B484DRAFT_325821 [Ochromonadaceae sp. CCMP2298]|nr:hypothetical protein B484DRAFT_325821 [Ochromonadaceae sp. CCMP2298]
MTPQERSVCAGRLNTTGSSSTSAPPSSDLSFPLNNVLLVLFPFPVALSAVRLFNYSKTPARGVRDFQLEVDGLLLYMGSLQRADRSKPYPQVVRAGQQQSSRRTRGQSVLFTNDNKIVQMHKDTVHYCGSGEQDVLCINERQVMVRSKHMYDQQPPNAALEGVQSDLQKR